MHGDDRGLSNHGSRARRSGGGMPGDAAPKKRVRTPSRRPVGGELEFHEEASFRRRVDESRADCAGRPVLGHSGGG